MVRSRYQLTRAAEFDLEGIWKYTHLEWGVRQASKYLRQLKRCIERLARKPAQGTPRDDLASGLLSYHEGRHLIFYRVDGKSIVIIRVLHDRMDVPQRLADKGPS